MLVQIENLPDYNAADEVVQEDQAALERDEREEEHEGGDNEEMQHEVTNTDALSNMLCSFNNSLGVISNSWGDFAMYEYMNMA